MGAYLFSVPAFAYSEFSGFSIIPQITGALLVAYAILDIIRRKSIKIPNEIWLYGFVGLWAAITFFLSSSINEGGALSLGTIVKVVVAALACAQLIKNETDFFTALNIFVFSILFVLYLNRTDLKLLRMAGQIRETDRFAGTLANANYAALFSLTVIWASILLLLHFRKWLLGRALFLIPIGLSLLIIYYSGSKRGLIGVGLFVLFFARLLYIRQRSSFYKKSLVILISSSLIIIAGYFVYTSPFFFRIEQLFYGGSDSDINRLDLAREAISVWLMNWETFFIGVGQGNFKFVSYQQTYSHVTPLELLANLGIIGFFLFMGFLFLLFRKFIFLYRNTFDQELKGVFYYTLVFLFFYSISMLTSVLYDSRELMPIFGCLAAFGQYHVGLMGQNQINELAVSVL